MEQAAGSVTRGQELWTAGKRQDKRKTRKRKAGKAKGKGKASWRGWQEDKPKRSSSSLRAKLRNTWYQLGGRREFDRVAHSFQDRLEAGEHAAADPAAGAKLPWPAGKPDAVGPSNL